MKTSVISLIFPLISAFGNDNGGYRQAQNFFKVTKSLLKRLDKILILRYLWCNYLPLRRYFQDFTTERSIYTRGVRYKVQEGVHY